MNTEFKHFHWSMPLQGQSLYGLYDLFDNHMFLLSYDFDTVWQLKKLMKSKVVLDIIDFSDQIADLEEKIDNSVVEKWGLENPPYGLFQDLKSASGEFQDKDLYKNHYLINDCKLIETDIDMDNFKLDLQQQLFFFHRCLYQAKNAHNCNEFMIEYLLEIAELSESYEEANDKFLNFLSITKESDVISLLAFLKGEKLFYE